MEKSNLKKIDTLGVFRDSPKLAKKKQLEETAQHMKDLLFEIENYEAKSLYVAEDRILKIKK